jgi:hypothetical protein
MHKIPNLLETPDLFLFGLTVRQGLMLLVGGGTGYLLFLHIFALFADPTLALLAGLGATVLFLGLTLALAFLQRGGRGLEEWGMVLLLYLARPRIYRWRPGLPARESAHRWSASASVLHRERARVEEQPW